MHQLISDTASDSSNFIRHELATDTKLKINVIIWRHPRLGAESDSINCSKKSRALKFGIADQVKGAGEKLHKILLGTK